MWLKFKTLIVMGALSLTFVSIAYAETQYIKDIKELDAKKEFTPLFRKLMLFEPFKRPPDSIAIAEIKETLDWLRMRGFYDNDSSRFTYVYAAWLWLAGFKDTAASMYFFADIKGRSDGERCMDKTSPRQRTLEYGQLLQGPITKFVQTQSNNTKEQIFKLATMKLNERLHLRQPDSWLCNGGIDYMLKYAEKHGNLKGKKTDTLTGSVVIVEDDSIQPDFVSDAVWQTNRRAATDLAIKNIRTLMFEQAPSDEEVNAGAER